MSALPSFALQQMVVMGWLFQVRKAEAVVVAMALGWGLEMLEGGETDSCLARFNSVATQVLQEPLKLSNWRRECVERERVGEDGGVRVGVGVGCRLAGVVTQPPLPASLLR